MTVKELIDILQKLPPDAEILFNYFSALWSVRPEFFIIDSEGKYLYLELEQYAPGSRPDLRWNGDQWLDDYLKTLS